VEWRKWKKCLPNKPEALSSNPSAAKKKKKTGNLIGALALGGSKRKKIPLWGVRSKCPVTNFSNCLFNTKSTGMLLGCNPKNSSLTQGVRQKAQGGRRPRLP
jgi:hypothetical protein